jgi:hypothetical protein
VDAEKAGGNVTLLLARLNTAGDLLSDSQNTYNSGTIANVTFNAEKARQTAEQVSIDAAKLLEISTVESQNSLWLTFIFSVTGSIVFLVFLLIIWRRFKRGYTKKLLNMKPEVIDNPS